MKTKITLFSLLLISVAGNILLGIQWKSAADECADLEMRTAGLRDAEGQIAALKKRNRALSLGALKGEGSDFEGALAELRRAMREYRESFGLDLKNQHVAQHYTDLAIERLHGFGS